MLGGACVDGEISHSVVVEIIVVCTILVFMKDQFDSNVKKMFWCTFKTRIDRFLMLWLHTTP